jgi:two-component system, OmpR family, sensor kinase
VRVAARIWAVSAAMTCAALAIMIITMINVLGPPPKVTPEFDEGPFVIENRLGARVSFAELPPPMKPAVSPMMLLPVGVILVALVLSSLLTARVLGRTLQKFSTAARLFGTGDLSARTGIVRSDELGDVAKTFDDMATRIGILVQNQKELLQNVSHELKTPLARVRVGAALLADKPIDDAGHALLRGIDEDLAELDVLIDNILTAAKLDAGNADAPHVSSSLKREPFACAQLVASAADRFQRLYRTHQLRVDVQGLASGAIIHGDERVLVRAIDNVLDNAGKYSEPTTTVDMVVKLDDSDVVIDVVDRGIGMDPKDIELLGTPFFRVDKSRHRDKLTKRGGTGLGLTLVKRIVAAHGGAVQFHSGQGQTTVRLRLPCAPPTN